MRDLRGLAWVSMAGAMTMAVWACDTKDDVGVPDSNTATGSSTITSVGTDDTTVTLEASCQCLAASKENYPDCASCWNSFDDLDEECNAAKNACLDDPDCVAVFDCLTDFEYSDAGIFECYVSLDDGAAKRRVNNILACYCSSPCMGMECTPQPDYTCPTMNAGPTNCGCIYSAADDPGGCGSCIADQYAGSCSTEATACNDDPDCAVAIDCLLDCGGASSPSTCVETCLSAAGASRELVESLYACACPACTEECDDTACDEG